MHLNFINLIEPLETVKMTWIGSGGQVASNQSPWRMSIFSDTFWAIINFIMLFFQTMFQPSSTKKGSGYTSDYRPGGDAPGGPRRRLGRPGGGNGGPSGPGNLPPGGG